MITPSVPCGHGTDGMPAQSIDIADPRAIDQARSEHLDLERPIPAAKVGEGLAATVDRHAEAHVELW